MDGIQKFSAFTYKTVDGETITATKQNGVVTLVGDKSGVRRMPMNEFMQEFINSVPKFNNGQPVQDTVNFSGNHENSVTQSKNRNKAIALAFGGLAVAVGTWLLTRGHNTKSLNKATQELGQEISDNVIKNGKETVEKVVNEVASKTNNVAKEAAEEVAEKVASKTNNVAKEAVEEVAEKVAPKTTEDVINEALEKSFKNKNKTSKVKEGTVLADASDKNKKNLNKNGLNTVAMDNNADMIVPLTDDLFCTNQLISDAGKNASDVVENVLNTKIISSEAQNLSSTPEIKIPRSVFEDKSDDIISKSDDILDEISEHKGKVVGDDFLEPEYNFTDVSANQVDDMLDQRLADDFNDNFMNPNRNSFDDFDNDFMNPNRNSFDDVDNDFMNSNWNSFDDVADIYDQRLSDDINNMLDMGDDVF